MNFDDMTDAEVEAVINDAEAELARRRTITSAETQLTEVLTAYQAAAGILDGTPWREPQGYLDAVPPGGTRVFEGDLYKVIADQPVTHSPAAAPEAWELVAENVDPSEPDPDDYPEWEVGMDLEAGDVVSRHGDLYETTTAHRTQPGWEPEIGGYLWKKLT